MARGSSGSGWGIAILIVVGMLASVPKEVWITVAIVAGVGTVIRRFRRVPFRN